MTSVSERVVNTALIILALAAAIVTSLLIRREFGLAKSAQRDTEALPAWDDYGNGGLRIGASAAPVTISVFSDYQCPFCRNLAITLDTLLQQHPEDVSVALRHFPIEAIHPAAIGAAIAAECADRQGRFPEMHNYLTQWYDSLGVIAWAKFAVVAGVADTARFKECLDAPASITRVNADRALGYELGIRGTPTIYVNARPLRRSDFAALDSAVRSHLARNDRRAR